LTVAGSDSGGGAGIQTDLKTFHTLGVFGTSAITCLTAQNPDRVSDVHAAPPAIVVAQMARVFEAFPVRAAKTGMLFNATIIRAVAGEFRRRKFRRLVVDPVMVASSGARLLRPDAVRVLTQDLLPQAALITPNRAEAEVLWGQPVVSAADARRAALALAAKFDTAVLIKGGHFDRGHWAVDVLCANRHLHEFVAPRVAGIRTHGTGCTLSAAIAGYLALGCDLVSAVAGAKQFIARALRTAFRVGRYATLNV
jgi:hydroxymethylpyrimidine/phosphomethylpyrimidine kinase